MHIQYMHTETSIHTCRERAVTDPRTDQRDSGMRGEDQRCRRQQRRRARGRHDWSRRCGQTGDNQGEGTRDPIQKLAALIHLAKQDRIVLQCVVQSRPQGQNVFLHTFYIHLGDGLDRSHVPQTKRLNALFGIHARLRRLLQLQLQGRRRRRHGH